MPRSQSDLEELLCCKHVARSCFSVIRVGLNTFKLFACEGHCFQAAIHLNWLEPYRLESLDILLYNEQAMWVQLV